MRISVIPGRDLSDDLAAKWERIRDGEPSLASPYFHPEFTRAVAQVRNDVFVSIVESAGDVVAFFPFQRGAMRAGRPVAGPLSDYHGVIAGPDFCIDAAQLMRASGLSTWTFDHCIATQAVFKPYHRTLSDSPLMDVSMGYEAYAAGRRAAGSKQILKTEGLVRKLEREVGPIRFAAHIADGALLQQCIDWKRSHYAEMKVNDVLGVEWTRCLLQQVLGRQLPGFAGMLSTLHVGDKLVAVHMGMRSRTVWHYWFPTYDREMSRFSPGIILLLRIAQTAPSIGVATIDLGKGSTMYKDRLSTGAVQIADGSIELPSIATTVGQIRRTSEEWIRRSPFFGVARIPGRFVKRAEKWLRFR